MIDGVVVDRKRHALTLADSPPAWDELLTYPQAIDLADVCVGVSSVVPTIASTLETFCADRNLALLSVNATLQLPFSVSYQTPTTLGADRVAGATAAFNRFGLAGRNLIVIDAGTAVNYEVVSASGVYLGGPIAPGLSAMRDSLVRGTAQLPAVTATIPSIVVGNSTTAALQAGIVFGFVDAVIGMIRRIEASLSAESADRVKHETFIVLTGGDAMLLSEGGVPANRIEPDLVLMGIADLMEVNPAQSGRNK